MIIRVKSRFIEDAIVAIQSSRHPHQWRRVEASWCSGHARIFSEAFSDSGASPHVPM
jgi:hypothetical protein